MFFALSLHAPSSPYHDELPSAFVTPLAWEMLSVLQHHSHVRHRGAELTLPVIPIPAEAVSLLWAFRMPSSSVSSPARWSFPAEKKRAVLSVKLDLHFAIFLSCLLSFLPSLSPVLSPSLTASRPLIPSAAKCHWHKIKVQWPCLDGGG